MATARHRREKTYRGASVFFLLRPILLSLLLLLPALTPAHARAQNGRNFDVGTRSVSGLVTGENGKPVSEAVVLLKNTKTLQVRSFLTKDDGAYRFFGLSMNDPYELRAQKDKASSGSKTLSQFDSRKEAKIDLKLK